MVMEEKARQEQKLIPQGHQVVNLRLRAHFSEADWAAEQMNGVSYLTFLRQLSEKVEKEWPAVHQSLEQLRHLLINRNNMLLNVICDEAGWLNLDPEVTAFLGELPSAFAHRFDWTPQEAPRFEGMTIPAQVNYVGKGANLYQLGYRLHGSVQVITRFLRTAWLWERVRVQGGAYGAFCLFNHLSGTLTFVSYRDPNLSKTLETFDQSAKFLRSADLGNEELNKSIIGTIGDIDRHLLPDAKGYTSMVRYLTEDTDDRRQLQREQVLATTPAEFRAFADVLEGVKETGLVKVMGAPSAIEEAGAEEKDRLQVINLL
jgi:Zn-dependent M16 (insulinase) family peptidase